MSTSEIFRCEVSYTIGDGNSVSFWKDRWCAQISLQSMFLHIFNAVVMKNQRVGKFIGTDGSRWQRILQGFTAYSTTDDDSIVALKDLVNTCNLSELGDETIWRWCNSGVFTVKSLYNFMQNGGVTETKFVMI